MCLCLCFAVFTAVPTARPPALGAHRAAGGRGTVPRHLWLAGSSRGGSGGPACSFQGGRDMTVAATAGPGHVVGWWPLSTYACHFPIWPLQLCRAPSCLLLAQVFS